MMEFTEKELFCLARHMIAQHYEEKYPLTYISTFNDHLEHYKKEKEKREMTIEETERAKQYYHQIQQSKREYQLIHGTFNGYGGFAGMPYSKLDCCEDCPNKKACIKVTDEKYTDVGTLETYSPSGTIMEEITEKLKPFIKENLKRLNLTDFDDWGVMDEF